MTALEAIGGERPLEVKEFAWRSNEYVQKTSTQLGQGNYVPRSFI